MQGQDIDYTQYQGILASRQQLGYEVGLTLDLANLIDYSAAATAGTVDANSDGYSYLIRMVNWYENNWQRYGLASNPYSDGSWPTTSYGSESGRTRFIYGHGVEPIECVVWTQAKWSDALALYKDVLYSIQQAIEKISAYSDVGEMSRYTYDTLSESEKEKVLREKQASESFNEYVYGSSSALSIAGLKVRKAYFLLSNIGGIFDARFDLTGAQLSSGVLVGSSRAAQECSGGLVRIGLAPGFIPGLDLSAAIDFTGGIASVVQDYNSKSFEYDPGEKSWMGLQLKAGYRFDNIWDGELGLSFTALAPDLIVRPLTLAGSLGAEYVRNGMISVRGAAEGDFLIWNPRYVSTSVQQVLSWAGAIAGSADYRGAGGRLSLKYKKAGYGSAYDSGNSAADVFYAFSAAGDFDEAKICDAMLGDAGLYFKPAGLLGRDYGKIEAGARVFLYGTDSALFSASALKGWGWYATLTGKLEDLVNIPLDLNMGIEHYTNASAFSGYSDYSAYPQAGLLTNSRLTASLVFRPTDSLHISIEGSDSDSGWKTDTGREMTLGLYARLIFDSGTRASRSQNQD